MKKLKMSTIKKVSPIDADNKYMPNVFMLLLLIYSSFLITACGAGSGKKSAPPASGNAILPLAPKLDPPTILVPATPTYLSNSLKMTVSGKCTPGPGAKLFLGGDENQSAPCGDDGTYSFEVVKHDDGIYNYTLHEETLTLHPSDPSDLTWTKSTTQPPPPTISSPYLSSSNSVTLSGNCIAKYLVTLSGDSSQTATCSDEGAYSFTIPKSVDGTYIFNITQTDVFGNISIPSTASWTRDTSVPQTPTITHPSASPYTSADLSLTISGTCSDSKSTIKLSGSATDSVGCDFAPNSSSGTYSFTIVPSSFGTFNYSISALGANGISSASIAMQWTRDASVPETPDLTSPNISTIINNLSSLVISGSCASGNTVNITGDSPTTIACDGSNAFSYTVNKSADGSFAYNISQTSPSNITSGIVSVSWVRDTQTPAAPIVTAPAITPYYSSNGNLTISGVCETGATINISGDDSGQTTCAGAGFSLNIVKSTSATYNFSLTQTDSAGNTSNSSSVQWILDKTAPTAPTLVSPSPLPFVSKTSSITVSGACENGTSVALTGSATPAPVTCASNSYSFTVTKSSDAIYSFSISQTDSAGNNSPTSSFQWTRDTLAPSAPTISSPSQNPFTSSDSSLTISGNCEVGATVNYSGAASGTRSCSSGTYSFSISQSVDDTYNLTLNQTDVAGNTSLPTNFQWNRLSSMPTTPAISSPSSNPAYSNTNSLMLSGNCTSGNTVQLTGDLTLSTTCASNSYSFNLAKSVDGTYLFSIVQINGSAISSSPATFTWVRDTVSPTAPPTIQSPTSNPYITNSSSLVISGTCDANSTIYYSGDASGTISCSATNIFSISLSNYSDGVYEYYLSQSDQAGNSSGTILLTWHVDNLAPAAPTLSQPTSNPITSGGSNMTLAGACESGATVNMTGASTQSVFCTVFNTFSFAFSETSNGTYNVNLTQTDSAGNISASTPFQWIRDASIPFSPVISVNSIETSTFASNTSDITVSVTCDTSIYQNSSPHVAAIVHLSGDIISTDVTSPLETLDQDCLTSPLTFTIHKTSDSVYSFDINQENPNNTNISPASNLIWTRDTSVPSAPTITTPSINPYTAPGSITISGACELDSTVYLSGDSTQNQFCLNNSYNFSIVKSTDTTYNFSLTQKDLAGNTSPAVTQSWIRNSNSLPPPTIATPATSPFASKLSSLTISGGCQSGYTVTLGGTAAIASDVTNPANSLEQICTSSGTYSFSISKSLDGNYDFSLTESFNSATSAAVSLTWKKDSTAPTVTLATTSANPNLTSSITFTLTTNETATLQCKLDTDSSYTSCTSPFTPASVANGSRVLSVIGSDTVGNISTAYTYSWTQAAYMAVVLYHLNPTPTPAPTPTMDFGLFTSTGAFNNNLVTSGTLTTANVGKLPSSSSPNFRFGTSNYFYTNSNDSLKTVASTLTVEGFVYISSALSSTGNYYTLVSNSGGASPNYGWEVRLVRSSTKYYLQFVGSAAGTSQVTLSSSTFTCSSGSWYYFVVTYNAGAVKFYFGSSSLTSRGIGTLSGVSKLYMPNVPLRLGSNTSSGTSPSFWLNGYLDEIRISNVVRSPLVFPTSQFTAD